MEVLVFGRILDTASGVGATLSVSRKKYLSV